MLMFFAPSRDVEVDKVGYEVEAQSSLVTARPARSVVHLCKRADAPRQHELTEQSPQSSAAMLFTGIQRAEICMEGDPIVEGAAHKQRGGRL